MAEPVGDGWNEAAAVLFNMEFGDFPHGDGFAGADPDGAAEPALGLEDAVCMMAKRAMAAIGKEFFGGVEPFVDR